MSESNRPIVNIYGVGGAGIKIVNAFGRHVDTGTPAFAKAVVHYQDTGNGTSKHLLKSEDSLYHYIGNESTGGGGIRQDVSESALRNVNKALSVQPPAEYNIVVHSLSGSTGSVVGPILAGELASKGKKVVCITVHNDSSQNALNNARATIATYDGVANHKKTPLLLRVHTGSAVENNKGVLNDIAWLLCLFSESHQGIDSKDVSTWIKRGSSSSPMADRAWLLEITGGKINGNCLSVLGLAIDETVQPAGGVVGFLKVGVPHSSIIASGDKEPNEYVISEKTPIWFAIRRSTEQILKELEAQAEDAKNAIAGAYDTSIASGANAPDGLVF